MTQEQALYKYCLRLGDNALIQSYRLSEWCSFGPILEEDLALTNFALDMTGRAQAILDYAGKVAGTGRSADDLAYRRSERDYYHFLVHDQPNGDFGYTMVRLLLTATYEFYFYTQLQNSADVTLAAIAAKSVKESKYHMAHATDWVIRMGDGTEESHSKVQNALNDLWTFTGELFEADEVEGLLQDKNIAADVAAIKEKWMAHVDKVLKEATLVKPQDGYMQTGGRTGLHAEYLGHILSEMQYLQRAYPNATW